MQTMRDSSVHTDNGYILKPVEFDNLSMAVEALSVFWQLVELPEVS